jgi:FMN phosphatase YigB (HAD superfamily)
MSGERIRGVVFDLDGTLYTLPMMRLRMTLALWRSVPLLSRLTAARRDVRGENFGSRDELIAALYNAIARRANTSIERATEWYESEFMPAFVALLARRAVVRPGLPALLGRLRERGVRTAVISDYARVKERLEALKIDPALFDDLVASEEHGVLKPSEIPFEAVAKRWGLAPAEILVVGDRKDHDEGSALLAGMDFAWAGKWQEASSAIEARTEPGVAT